MMVSVSNYLFSFVALNYLVTHILATQKKCLNDPDHVHKSNPKITCQSIRDNEERRKKYCQHVDMRVYCPISCGLCCEDDPSYTFETLIEPHADCKYLAEKEIRQSLWCGQLKGGRAVRDSCPLACNFCAEYVQYTTMAMSMDDTPISHFLPSSSSFPPDSIRSLKSSVLPSTVQSQSEIQKPSISSDEVPPLPVYSPIIRPSTLRTLQSPTDPSILPTAVSSADLIDAPSVPSKKPSSSLLIGSSTSPSYIPSPSPSIKSSASPSVKSSSGPSVVPTNIPAFDPTDALINNPSASLRQLFYSLPRKTPSTFENLHVNAAYTCADKGEFRIDTQGEKSCKWVRWNETRRKRECAKEDVRINCPVSCGHCCRDNASFTFETINRGTKTCAWIAKKPVSRATANCDLWSHGQAVKDACPLACDWCTDSISLLPSTTPSDTPSDAPSDTPSDAPSDTPSDTPSKNNPSLSPTRGPIIKTKPNIMIIMADDVGIGDIRGKVRTPNIDKLAQQGTSFLNAHATPLCAPSRYVLLSGNYQHRGCNPGGTWVMDSENNFRSGQQSLAKVLKEGGNYMTNVVGKWHLGAKVPPNGRQAPLSEILSSPLHNWTEPLIQGARQLGFGSSYITDSGIQGPPYAFFRNDFLTTDVVKNWKRGAYKMPHGKSKILETGQGAPDWDSTAFNMILVNETEKFLDRFIDEQVKNPEKPFFSYVALGAAHIPHSPPDVYLDGDPIAHQYPTAHMNMLLEMDKVVGSIVHALEDRGLVDNTLIIFLSDNGGLGGKNDSDEFDHHSNARLRGSKGQIYEGGHRIPLIMRYDGVFPTRQVRNNLIGINDIFATVCDVAGVAIPIGHTAVDSISFLDYIKDKTKKNGIRMYLGIWRYYEGKLLIEAMISNKFKVVHFLPNITDPKGTVEYYNLKEDPGETTDLSKYPKYRNGIQDLLKKLHILTDG